VTPGPRAGRYRADMATGTPNGRAAMIATASALGAVLLAGLASVVVQLDSVIAYVVFALLVVVVVALVASAGYWIRRARVTAR
jgi:hypothetical protein